MDLKRKNVLVTGGGGVGVGAGICQALVRCGATILLNELRIEDARRAATKYPGAVPLAADVSNNAEVLGMFDLIKDKVGDVHAIVNNAGIGLSKIAHEASEAEYDRLYDVDLKGVWHVSKVFAQELIKDDRQGCIVNISSVHACATMSRYALYAGAKAAVEGLTRGMAVELGPHNIRVNAVAPGYVHAQQNYELIKTWADDPHQWVDNYIKDQQVLLREIEPQDCGNVVAFLLSSMSRSITGQTIYVDNGTSILLFNRYSTEKH